MDVGRVGFQAVHRLQGAWKPHFADWSAFGTPWMKRPATMRLPCGAAMVRYVVLACSRSFLGASALSLDWGSAHHSVASRGS